MSGPHSPFGGPDQCNHQSNQSKGKGQFYANQGGKQSIKNYTTSSPRSRTGRTLLVLVVLDVASLVCFSMTGPRDVNDGWQQVWSAAFLAFLVLTVRTYRRWKRRRDRL